MFSSFQATLGTTKHTLWAQSCVGQYETRKEEDLAKGFEWVGKGQNECGVFDFVGCVLGDPK
jgi:hypothetical protein